MSKYEKLLSAFADVLKGKSVVCSTVGVKEKIKAAEDELKIKNQRS